MLLGRRVSSGITTQRTDLFSFPRADCESVPRPGLDCDERFSLRFEKIRGWFELGLRRSSASHFNRLLWSNVKGVVREHGRANGLVFPFPTGFWRMLA